MRPRLLLFTFQKRSQDLLSYTTRGGNTLFCLDGYLLDGYLLDGYLLDGFLVVGKAGVP